MIGMFITFEGTEGVGKSTQLDLLAAALADMSLEFVRTREPGGTAAGEDMREILLHRNETPLSDEAELLLMFAARAQHLAEVIRPALAAGKIVLCDRFTDATYAYQGGGRGIAPGRIATLEQWLQGSLRPHLTLLLDAPVGTGMTRARGRGNGADRFEREQLAFFERVRAAYLAIAAREPVRVAVIDATADIATVHANVLACVRAALTVDR